MFPACYAESTAFPAEVKALYEASEPAIHGSASTAALEVMEGVAENKPINVILDAAKRAGLELYFKKEFHRESSFVRSLAFRDIGRTGLPEAVAYLRTVTPEVVGSDDSQSIYPASQVALQDARVRAERDPERQIVLLREQFAAPRVAEVALWAVNELCDRGDRASLPKIEQFFARRSRGIERSNYCEERIEIIDSSDRTKSLGAVLRTDLRSNRSDILSWAITKLLEMNTQEAEQILDRYLTEVAQVFPDVASIPSTADSEMHRRLAQDIRRVRAARRHKKDELAGR